MLKIMTIENMSCGHCKNTVETTLKDLDGVTSAEVDLETGEAKVELEKEIDDSLLKNAVEDKGYPVVSIK